MQIQLIYFAGLRDLAGVPQEDVGDLPDASTVESLVQEMLRRRPELRMDGVRVAVNEEFVENGHSLADGDVVALIPPVSGG